MMAQNPTLDTLKKFPFAVAVVNETLRLFPPGAIYNREVRSPKEKFIEPIFPHRGSLILDSLFSFSCRQLKIVKWSPVRWSPRIR